MSARSSNADARAVRLRILDKEVQIACKPGDEDALNQAAAHVDKAMRELRQRNTTSNVEKIAIVTAINTANALLKARAKEIDSDALAKRVAASNEQLKSLLDDLD